MVLDGLPGLYGLKYDIVTTCRLLLYLCSYKLDGSATADIRARFNTKHVVWVFKNKAFVAKTVFQLIDIYKCSKIKKNLWCTDDHIPCSPIKDF